MAIQSSAMSSEKYTYICFVSNPSVSSVIHVSLLFSELTLAALDINTLASELAVSKS